MKIEKTILVLYILCFFGFGLPGVLFPQQFSAILQYQFTSPAGKTEFVAAYGGLILGIGAYLIYCLKTNIQAGLVCIAIIIGFLFLGRITGYMTGGEIDNTQIIFLALESFTLLVIGYVLIKGQPFEKRSLSLS